MDACQVSDLVSWIDIGTLIKKKKKRDHSIKNNLGQ